MQHNKATNQIETSKHLKQKIYLIIRSNNEKEISVTYSVNQVQRPVIYKIKNVE